MKPHPEDVPSPIDLQAAADGLYMTVDEQRQALLAAGFMQVNELLRLRGMVLHRAA